MLLGQQLFPLDYPINQNIANAPIATNSLAVMTAIGLTVKVHPDLGYDVATNTNDALYGIPVNVVHGNSVAKVNVVIGAYGDESDILPVPIPANTIIEGDFQSGPNLNSSSRGDSHCLIWDEDNNIAYELFGASRPTDTSNTAQVWSATQESVWQFSEEYFRTLGWTSVDAAGLAVTPLLLRPDEALPVSSGGQGVIKHALRFTLPSANINPQYIYPASHMVSVSSQSTSKLPMGARIRLRNSSAVNTKIAAMGPSAQIAATAMQQYGLILADDGSSMYVTGCSGSVDSNNNLSLVWNVPDILTLNTLVAGDFDVVNLTPILNSLSITTGSVGSSITLTGQNFSGSAGKLSVLFGSVPATSPVVVNDTEITAIIPSGTGTVNVTVQSGIIETDTVSSNKNANVTAPIFGYGLSNSLSFTYGGSMSATDTLTVTVNGVALATTPSITVTPGAVSSTNSTVTLASPSVASGSTDVITIVVKDSGGNPITGLPSTAFVFALSGGTSTGTFSTVTESTTTPGTYSCTFTGALV